MPFVFKGTTVKKLNYRGTACKKHIAKGVQVWSAEETLYPNGGFTPASNSEKMNGGSASGFKISISGTYNCNANRYIGLVDLSKYKSIKIAYTAKIENASNNKSYPAIALVTNTNFWAVYACDSDSPGTDIVSTGCHKRIKTAGSGTITFDVSKLSSKVYIWEGLWETVDGIGGGTIEITSIIAEPS